MSVEVIGDLPHDSVERPAALTEAAVRRIAQPPQHVVDLIDWGLGSMEAPDHHRGVTDLTVGDPADLILEVPVRELGRLAQLADLLGVRHLVFSVTVDPTATVFPTPGTVDCT